VYTGLRCGGYSGEKRRLSVNKAFLNTSDHLSPVACFLYLVPQANCTRSAFLLHIFLPKWFTLKHRDPWSRVLLFTEGYQRILPCWRTGQGYLVSSRLPSRTVPGSSAAKIGLSFDGFLEAGLSASQRGMSVQATVINRRSRQGEGGF
jgi:hypothetical protein